MSEVEERISNDNLVDLARKQEQPFLSMLLKDKDCLMDAVSFGIKPEHFWDYNCRFLFSIMSKNYKEHSSLLTRSGMDNIMDMVEAKGLNDEKKLFYKKFWDETYFIESNLEDYELFKKSINDRYIQWQAYKIVDKYTQNIVGAVNNQTEMIHELKKEINAIDNVDPNSHVVSVAFTDSLDRSMDYIKQRRDNPNVTTAVPTGLKALDDIIFGLECPSYTVITGYINGGKTTLMFNLAMNMAKAGRSVVYVTMEKEADPLVVRLHFLHAMVDYNRVKRGGNGERGLPNHIVEILKNAKDDLQKNILPNLDFIQVPQTTKLSKILTEVDKIIARKKVDVLFLDYLQVVGFESNHPTRPDIDLTQLSQRLQAYGRVNRLITITAMQLKSQSAKEIRNKSKKIAVNTDIQMAEVNTEDIGGAQAIIADADYAFSVVKDAKDKPCRKVYITVVKSRDSDMGRVVQLDFDGCVGRISDPELEPGQVKEISEIIYNKEITEEQIESDDDLFKKTDEKVEKEEKEKPREIDLDEEITTTTTTATTTVIKPIINKKVDKKIGSTEIGDNGLDEDELLDL